MPTFPRRVIIALVGPCGAGKSTLANAFRDFPGVDVVQEVQPKLVDARGNYQDLDMPAIQREFLGMRLEQAMAARTSVVVLDRSVEEDRAVFLQLHYELGGLTEQELADLEELARRTGELIGMPAATVIMRAETEVLRHRIGNGARPEWLEKSFDRQLKLYSKLIASITGAVLELDTTHRPPSTLRSVALWIVQTAWLAAARERRCSSEELGLLWDWRSA